MIIPPTLQNNMRAVVVYIYTYISHIYHTNKLRKKYYHISYTNVYIYFFIILLIQENNYQHIQMLFYSN